MTILDRALRVGEGKKFKTFEKVVARINDYEPELELDSDEELRARYEALRERHLSGESLDDLLPEAFALTREAGKRSLGQRHFDVQLIGGMVLHDGSIAEMKTGEGKTLTATLPIVLNALSSRDENGHPAEGKGIHLVTVNDYLARRDALWMKPIYDFLGVTVGIIQSGQNDIDKQEAYSRDVVYGTNSEFGFDYLRDNLAVEIEQKAQRGHGFSIVDEVDNILIDEARTPLIISGQPEQAADLYYKFAKLAKTMEPGKKPEGLEAKSKEYEADFDFEPDEKHKTVAVTERGVEKAERFLGVDNLYRAELGNMVNHLQQSLKAESLYKRDVDYAVIDGEVKIIDEFTGRILEGRRWSEGLHQAVEAKEDVAIQEENQTVATITYQNYFRRYDKLGGMTGTALTEATEFMKIYELQVVEVPTNLPMVRDDQNDQIYKTKDGKWAAVANEIEDRHAAGQPVLVGTISVEVSELLSEQLNKRGIKHTVLNAKPEHAEHEGEIIAEAGQPGAVTIATNMAGRGVDIKLGGNEEHLTQRELVKRGLEPDTPRLGQRLGRGLRRRWRRRCVENREKVMEAGGLFICGTERHESRRIDNQLRGRSGRQGDPGESRFYLSAEDDLVRLFAGDRIYRILDNKFLAQADDDGNELPIEHKMLSKQIENAQKKVEEQNFLIRKRVLEYDDVMNQQREIVYEYRDRILEGEDMSEIARTQIADAIERLCGEYIQGEYQEDWELERAARAARADLRRLLRGRRRRGARDARHVRREAARGRGRRLQRPRGGARQRAHARPRALHAPPDHRRALARAPARHGLPARGHPPARVRPDRPARGLQERGLRHVHGAHEQHLGRVRPLRVQRRGGGAAAGPGPGQRHALERGREHIQLEQHRAPTTTRAERPRTSRARSRGRRGRRRGARRGGRGGRLRRRRRCSSRRPWSRRRCSTSTSGSAATTPAGAARARSSRSAMERRR